jgi:hypothetical protein
MYGKQNNKKHDENPDTEDPATSTTACAKIKERTIHIYAQRINTDDFIIDFNAC